jgi:hypothetical protein
VAGWCCGLPNCHESVGDDGAGHSHCELDTAERASAIGFRRRRSCSGARAHACAPFLLARGRPHGGTRWAVCCFVATAWAALALHCRQLPCTVTVGIAWPLRRDAMQTPGFVGGRSAYGSPHSTGDEPEPHHVPAGGFESTGVALLDGPGGWSPTGSFWSETSRVAPPRASSSPVPSLV